MLTVHCHLLPPSPVRPFLIPLYTIFGIYTLRFLMMMMNGDKNKDMCGWYTEKRINIINKTVRLCVEVLSILCQEDIDILFRHTHTYTHAFWAIYMKKKKTLIKWNYIESHIRDIKFRNFIYPFNPSNTLFDWIIKSFSFWCTLHRTDTGYAAFFWPDCLCIVPTYIILDKY